MEYPTIQSFYKKQTQSKPESFDIAHHIVDSVCQNIIDHYEYIEFVNQKKTNQNQEQGVWIQLFNRQKRQKEEIPKYLLEQIQKEDFIRRFEIQNEYLPKKIIINHIKVHKQFVPNLCGYHASYNLIQAIHSIKYRIKPRFEDMAAFWSYTIRTQKYLKDYAIRTGEDRSSWPWTDDDILYGDFERTYLKVCLAGKPLFKQTLKNEKMDGVQYTILYGTLYYQFGVIVNEDWERQKLSQDIINFIEFVPKENSQMIFAFMLGITNHWVSMVVQKSVKGVDFIFMDSRLKDFLPLNEEEIVESVKQDNELRIQKGQKGYSDFQINIYQTGYKDIQECIGLIGSCLLGNQTIESYITNSRVKVFIFPLIKQLNLNMNSYIMSNVDQICQNSFNIVQQWADSYRHTINNYLYIQIKNMTEENKQLIRKSVLLVKRCLDHERQHKLWKEKNRSRLDIVYNGLITIKNRL